MQVRVNILAGVCYHLHLMLIALVNTFFREHHHTVLRSVKRVVFCDKLQQLFGFGVPSNYGVCEVQVD